MHQRGGGVGITLNIKVRNDDCHQEKATLEAEGKDHTSPQDDMNFSASCEISNRNLNTNRGGRKEKQRDRAN